MSALRKQKIEALQANIGMWLKQYTAVSKQFRLEINPMTKTTLQAQLDDLESQIETAETELAELETQAEKPVSPTSADKVPDGTTKQQLYWVLSNKYNISEIHDLIFDGLLLDHEVVIGNYGTRKEMARELISYCERHGRFDELVTLVKNGRSHLWN